MEIKLYELAECYDKYKDLTFYMNAYEPAKSYQARTKFDKSLVEFIINDSYIKTKEISRFGFGFGISAWTKLLSFSKEDEEWFQNVFNTYLSISPFSIFTEKQECIDDYNEKVKKHIMVQEDKIKKLKKSILVLEKKIIK